MQRIMYVIMVSMLFLISNSLSQVLPPPTLNSPNTGYSSANAPSSFTWSQVSGNAGYEVAIADNSGMSYPIVSSGRTSANTTSWSISSSQWNSLTASSTYYWSVRTWSSGGQAGNWATPWSIVRQALTQVINMSVSPNPVSFGSVNVDQSSKIPVIFTNQSSSNSNLTITAGFLSSPFSDDATQSYIISPGSSKTINVTFSPTSAGSFSQTWVINHNATNQTNPLDIPVGGTGVLTQVINMSVSPNPVSFGSVNVDQSSKIPVIFTNQSSSNSNLTITAGFLSSPFSDDATQSYIISPGSSKTINVTFSPTSAGSFSQTWVINHNATNQTNPLDIPVGGTGVLTQVINMSVSPNPVSFGSVNVDQSSKIPVIFTNQSSSNSNLTITAGFLSSPFSDDATQSYIISPGSSKTINVTFSPTSAGSFSQTWVINHNATNQTNPLDIPVGGTGVLTQVINMSVSPNPVSFGSVNVDQSSKIPVIFTNQSSSNSNLTITAGFLSSPFSDDATQSYIISPGSSKTINVTFSPTSAGSFSQTWVINHNATNQTNPLDIPLDGTRIGPATNITVNCNKNTFHFYDTITFTINLKDQNNNPVPNKAIAVFDPNPNLLICPVAFTNSNGVAAYTVNSDTMEGWMSYGFLADTAKAIYPILVINKNFNDPDLKIVSNVNPVGFVPPSGASSQPINVNDVMNVLLSASVSTITNPFIVGGDIGCGLGLIASVATSGAAIPVAGIVCDATLDAAYGNFVLQAGTSASKKLVESSNLNSTDKANYNNDINLVSWGTGIISLTNSILETPQGSEEALSFKISNNEGYSATKYASDFYYHMKDFSDQIQATSELSNILVSKNSINDSIEALNIVCKIKVNDPSLSKVSGVTDAVYIDRYQLTSVGFTYNKNRVASVRSGSSATPVMFSLSPNYPNPFNPSTNISYALPERSKVKIVIYDVLGQELQTLVDGVEEAGYQSVQFVPRGLASGIYFCRMVAVNTSSSGKNFTATTKIVFVK